MITQRRVFQAKPGAPGAVVAKMKEFQAIFTMAGGPHCRIYTDHLSGHTDRVVWEFDSDSLSALEEMFWAASQNAEYQAPYQRWYDGLRPSIEGTTVELWTLES